MFTVTHKHFDSGYARDHCSYLIVIVIVSSFAIFIILGNLKVIVQTRQLGTIMDFGQHRLSLADIVIKTTQSTASSTDRYDDNEKDPQGDDNEKEPKQFQR